MFKTMDLTTHARPSNNGIVVGAATDGSGATSGAAAAQCNKTRVAKSVFSIRSLVDVQESENQLHQNNLQQQIDAATSESNYSGRTG